MKKITLIALIAGSTFTTNQLIAQGGLKKLKDKMENALTPKGQYYNFTEDIAAKTKTNGLLASKAFKVISATEIHTCKYNNEDVNSSSFLEKYTKKEMPGAETIFVKAGTSGFHEGAIKINDTTYMFIDMMGVECELKNLSKIRVYSSNKDFMEDIAKNYDKAASYKVLETKMTDYITAWNGYYAANAAADAKKAEEAQNAIELPKPADFMPLPQSVLMKAIQQKFNPDGKHKIVYAYYATPSHIGTKNLTDWKIIKEMKTVNGTYDKFITRRSLDVVFVIQYSDAKDKTKYTIQYAQLCEDAAFGVYDGSKYSGKYYMFDFGLPINTYCPEKNAMKYINVLK